MTLAYSLIPYKTPGALLGPLDAMILLPAPAQPHGWNGCRERRGCHVDLLAVVCFQAWRASFPLSSDPRNPYAYAHTGRDVYALRDRLESLGRGQVGTGRQHAEPLAAPVVSAGIPTRPNGGAAWGGLSARRRDPGDAGDGAGLVHELYEVRRQEAGNCTCPFSTGIWNCGRGLNCEATFVQA